MLNGLFFLLRRGWNGMRGINREPKLRHEDTVRFLYEQDGEPERMLKNAIQPLLTSRSEVARAYLARVGYGDSSAYEVALCLPGPADENLVREVGSVFAEQFGRRMHLDIVFLNGDQEAELRTVCRPFYEAAGNLSPE